MSRLQLCHKSSSHQSASHPGEVETKRANSLQWIAIKQMSLHRSNVFVFQNVVRLRPIKGIKNHLSYIIMPKNLLPFSQWACHNPQNADSVQDSNEPEHIYMLRLADVCMKNKWSRSGYSLNMRALMALPVSSLPRSSVWVLGLGSVHSPHLATNTDYQLIRRQTDYRAHWRVHCSFNYNQQS